MAVSVRSGPGQKDLEKTRGGKPEARSRWTVIRSPLLARHLQRAVGLKHSSGNRLKTCAPGQNLWFPHKITKECTSAGVYHKPDSCNIQASDLVILNFSDKLVD